MSSQQIGAQFKSMDLNFPFFRPMRLSILPSILLSIAACGLLPSSAVGDTISAHVVLSPTSLEDPTLNPWVEPLNQCAVKAGNYQLDMDMGFLNTDYFCRIDPELGVQFQTKTIQTTNRDAARLVLSKVNACQFLNSERILVGASRNNVEQIQSLVPSAPQNSIIKIGKRNAIWGPPKTHAKVFQLGNGIDQFFTVHGSLNLQTVGLTCKANNALRFTETNPVLYNYFHQLGDAVEFNNGKSGFVDGGSVNSSGTLLPPVDIGNYTVHFYGGKGMGFVGIGPNSGDQSWPNYINPPFTSQHIPCIVNWYDAVIYDAAKQLRQGRSVKIDVLIFEIGEESAFVNNLWNFVRNGFATGKTENKTSNETVSTPFIGKLEVRFLWQFQSSKNRFGKTYSNLNGPNKITNVDSKTQPGAYSLESARIWPVLDRSGIAINPGTPRDMHNKLAVMDVPGHENERRIYVTSSNMDTPNIGSGKLWQAGTIIQERSWESPWSGANTNKPNLWNAYKQYFDLLWSNREGQSNAGQINFSKLIDEKRSAGFVNWIETVPTKARANFDKPKEGIDVFFFPIPISQ